MEQSTSQNHQRLFGRRTPIHLPLQEKLNSPAIVFLTVCTSRRKPILCSDIKHALLVSAWERADEWIIGRYVLMPDHLHLFCAPAKLDPVPLSKWVHYWKSVTSRSWPVRSEQPIWQKSFWDRQLRSGSSYEEKWEYVRRNPVRKGLVKNADDWPHQGVLNILEWFG